MICEMDYEKMTVKELCARARINKKTFYRYYETLDDLLAELQAYITHDYLKRIENYRIPEELDKINRELFLYSVEKGPVYERITCSGSCFVPTLSVCDSLLIGIADIHGVKIPLRIIGKCEKFFPVRKLFRVSAGRT